MTSSYHTITLPYQVDFLHDSQTLGPDFVGSDPQGHEIALTSYYLTVDGVPEYMVMGEFLFERIEPWQWRDELIKLRMGGVNVISTYVYWNFHQPEEGQWINRGRMDIRRFAGLCKELGLYLIVRIGPYVHSEIRNGGLPDWLYGKPYRSRESDRGFLKAVERYFQHLGEELQGMMYDQGGPIIACQVDNEYGHSSSLWEMTRDMGDEWVNMGSGGDQYLLNLRSIAEKAGFVVPFYTATAWGGAATTQRVLPMWGGYAYRPWLFFQPWMRGESKHPATQEFVYRDFHSNEAVSKSSYDLFDPQYQPESMPYACCEIGAGMFNSYAYRFIVDPKSVDALANVKLASGCNFLGYYVYRGGTNPVVQGQYMNETQTPRIDYDFQAPIGQWGQIRESYRRLKTIHYFVRSFGELLCGTHTVLPAGADDIRPEDADTLRYAVRARGESGFLFINNFQDHVQTHDQIDQTIDVEVPQGGSRPAVLRFDNLGLQKGENCILPFNMDCDGVLLRYSTMQPLVHTLIEGVHTFVFFRPAGMPTARLVFDDDVVIFPDEETAMMVSRHTSSGREIRFLLLSRDLAESLFLVQDRRPGSHAGDHVLLFSDEAILEDSHGIRMESEHSATRVYAYPPMSIGIEGSRNCTKTRSGILAGFDCSFATEDSRVEVIRIDDGKWELRFDFASSPLLKNRLLNIEYRGDVGQAFIDGQLIHDNFCNGQTWQIGLHEYEGRLNESPMVIVIVPRKEKVVIDVDSPMAARHEEASISKAELLSVSLTNVYEWPLTAGARQ